MCMRLETWLKIKKIKVSAFAKQIGKNRSLVHKYLYEDVIPKRDVMLKIYFITLGAVTADDFYKLPTTKYFDEKIKKKNASA